MTNIFSDLCGRQSEEILAITLHMALLKVRFPGLCYQEKTGRGNRRSRGDLHNEMMCLQSRVRQFENMLKKTPREG